MIALTEVIPKTEGSCEYVEQWKGKPSGALEIPSFIAILILNPLQLEKCETKLWRETGGELFSAML